MSAIGVNRTSRMLQMLKDSCKGQTKGLRKVAEATQEVLAFYREHDGNSS